MNLKNYKIYRTIAKINDVNVTTYIFPPEIQSPNISGFNIAWMSSIGVTMVGIIVYYYKKRESL